MSLLSPWHKEVCTTHLAQPPCICVLMSNSVPQEPLGTNQKNLEVCELGRALVKTPPRERSLNQNLESLQMASILPSAATFPVI